MHTPERTNHRSPKPIPLGRKTAGTLRLAACLTALAVAALGIDPLPARAQTTQDRTTERSPAIAAPAAEASSSSAPTSGGSAGSTAPKREPMISPEFAAELQRKYGPGGTHSNPAWNPDIQERVIQQLQADGFFEREPPTPWYVPARKFGQAIFACSMLIVAIRQYRANKKAKAAGAKVVAAGPTKAP